MIHREKVCGVICKNCQRNMTRMYSPVHGWIFHCEKCFRVQAYDGHPIDKSYGDAALRRKG